MRRRLDVRQDLLNTNSTATAAAAAGGGAYCCQVLLQPVARVHVHIRRLHVRRRQPTLFTSPTSITALSTVDKVRWGHNGQTGLPPWLLSPTSLFSSSTRKPRIGRKVYKSALFPEIILLKVSRREGSSPLTYHTSKGTPLYHTRPPHLIASHQLNPHFLRPLEALLHYVI